MHVFLKGQMKIESFLEIKVFQVIRFLDSRLTDFFLEIYCLISQEYHLLLQVL